MVGVLGVVDRSDGVLVGDGRLTAASGEGAERSRRHLRQPTLEWRRFIIICKVVRLGSDKFICLFVSCPGRHWFDGRTLWTRLLCYLFNNRGL